MKACGSCVHLRRLTDPIEARATLLVGICALNVRSYSRAPVVAEDSGIMCRDFECASEARAEAVFRQFAEEEAL